MEYTENPMGTGDHSAEPHDAAVHGEAAEAPEATAGPSAEPRRGVGEAIDEETAAGPAPLREKKKKGRRRMMHAVDLEEGKFQPAANSSLGLRRKSKTVRMPMDPRVILWSSLYPLWILVDNALNCIQCLLTPILCPIHFAALMLFTLYRTALQILLVMMGSCQAAREVPGGDIKPCRSETYFNRYGEDRSGNIDNIVDPSTGESKFYSFDLASADDYDKHLKMKHNMELIEELRKLPMEVLTANVDKDAVTIARMDMILLYGLGFFDLLSDGLFLIELNSRDGRPRETLLPLAAVFTWLSFMLYLKDLADKHNKTKMLIVKELLADHEIDLPVISYISNDVNTKLSFLVEDVPQICLLAAFVYFTGEPLGTLGKVSYWLSSAAVVLKTEVKSVANLSNVCMLLKYVVMGFALLPCFLCEAAYASALRGCCMETPRHFKRVTSMLTLHIIPFALSSVLSALWIVLSFVLYFTFLA